MMRRIDSATIGFISFYFHFCIIIGFTFYFHLFSLLLLPWVLTFNFHLQIGQHLHHRFEHQNFTFGDKSHLPLPSHFTFFMLVQHCWYYFGWKGEELSSLISWSPPHLEMDFTFFTFSFLRFFAFFQTYEPVLIVHLLLFPCIFLTFCLLSMRRNEKAVLRQLSPSTFLYFLHRLKSLQKKV